MATAPQVPSFRLPKTDRPFRSSVVISIAIHAIVLSLFLVHEIRQRDLDEAARHAPGAPGTRGGGGGAVFRIYLPPASAEQAPAVVVEKPAIPPAILPPPIKIQRLDVPMQTGTVSSTVDMSKLAGQGPGSGGGQGTGAGPGLGADSGRGTGGEGGDVFPPTPRYTILPPLPQPASMRGHTLRVHFWVNAQGRVVRVLVDPEIKDAAYRQQFLAMMREYTFNPAKRLDGTTVEGELVMPITL